MQPFHRLDASRSQPGSGLGLALVKTVAQYHRAQLQMQDAAPGLQVTLRLPTQATNERPPTYRQGDGDDGSRATARAQ